MSAEDRQAAKQRKEGEQEKTLVDKALEKAREKGFVDKADETVNKMTGRPR